MTITKEGVSVVSLHSFLKPFSFSATLPQEPTHATLEAKLKELGLLKSSIRFRDLPFHKLSYYCVPNGTEEQLEIVTAVLTFMFLFDDQFDDTEELRNPSSIRDIVSRMGIIWRTNTLPDDSTSTEQLGHWVNHLLIEYADKWHTNSDDQQSNNNSKVYSILVRDLIQYIEEGIEPFLELQANCSSQKVPSMEEYMKVRRMNVGAYPLVSLINFVNNICSSEEFLCRTEVQRMLEIVVDLVTITNDVFSYSKDKVSGFSKNYFNILLLQHGLNPQVAVEYATKETTDLINEFTDLKMKVYTVQSTDSTDKMDSGAVARQNRFVDDLLPIVSASVQWSLDIERYTSPTSPFAEFRKTNEQH
jgi:hypothetical protein